MKIEFDDNKRRRTLSERGLDFSDANQVFGGNHFDVADERFDYGEPRVLTFGTLNGRPVVVVWTPRGSARRIISMRHVHDEELESRRRSLD